MCVEWRKHIAFSHLGIVRCLSPSSYSVFSCISRDLQTDNEARLMVISLMQMALVSDNLKPTAEPWSLLGYLHRPKTEDEVKGISHWVVTDLDTEVRSSIALGPSLWHKDPGSTCLCWDGMT